MKKAYGRLEWNFIFEILKKFGFLEKWIGWIKECITTSTFSALVNTSQGNNLNQLGVSDWGFEYIFIICARLLVRKLQSTANDPKSGIGIKISKNTENIPFLTFANDTMIFVKANKKSCAIIKNVTQEYCNMSGQLINYHETSGHFG